MLRYKCGANNLFSIFKRLALFFERLNLEARYTLLRRNVIWIFKVRLRRDYISQRI